MYNICKNMTTHADEQKSKNKLGQERQLTANKYMYKYICMNGYKYPLHLH